MKQGRHPTVSHSGAPDVLKHLAESFDTGWKRYRKRLKRCQAGFSEDAVHQSRVQTRRLLSTVELLGAFIPEDKIKKVRVALKKHLDTFDKLRDTQVQLVYVGHMLQKFPAARGFRDWLLKREKRFTREAQKAIRQIKPKRTGRRIASFEKQICRLRKRTTPKVAFRRVEISMSRAFARVAHFCRHVQAKDSNTIHRTRIAFKRFRYMVEGLSPLLPAVTDEHRRAMHGYQSMMGDIQDVEVLIAAMEKFIRRGSVGNKSSQALLAELQHRRKWLIRVYLNAAGKLRQFWPVQKLAPAAQTVKIESQTK
jgi:CHAD domain-containing protein